MTDATRHTILSRHRDRQFGPTSKADFTLGPGQSAPLSELTDPLWSLYSLDLEDGTAIFTRLAPGTNLSAAAFIPDTQFRAATDVLTLPLDRLLEASAPLPQPDKHVFLFSIGRCGTTLAHHILNTVPGVLALSEPRPFVTLAMARQQMPVARAADLIQATIRFLYRPTKGQTTLALKLHSQCLYQADHFHSTFPQANYLFLYRDAPGWANSFSRFMQNLGTPLDLDPALVRRFWMIVSADTQLDHLRPWLDPDAPLTRHAPSPRRRLGRLYR